MICALTIRSQHFSVGLSPWDVTRASISEPFSFSPPCVRWERLEGLASSYFSPRSD